MLQARAERPAEGAGAGPARLWVPGMIPLGQDDGGSARSREIARSREELLGMLHDLPESDYELSLTDLVDETGNGGGNGAVKPPPPEGKDVASPPVPGQSASGRQAEQPTAAAKAERRASSRRRDGSGSFRSSSDGVLLNFYMPRSLTRSFTAPRPGRTPSISGGRTSSVISEDCSRRERDGDTVKCWSLLWDRRWRKSSKRDPNAPPSESTVCAASAAILKAAKHSAFPSKV